MFARYKVVTAPAPRIIPDDGAELDVREIRIGTAFQQADGSIMVHLDALPVSGRVVLVPEADARAKPVRRGPL